MLCPGVVAQFDGTCMGGSSASDAQLDFFNFVVVAATLNKC